MQQNTQNVHGRGPEESHEKENREIVDSGWNQQLFVESIAWILERY